jgi:hypothetical protein
VQDDLRGLDISRQELQRLTDLPVNETRPILSNPIKRLVRQIVEKVKGPEGATVVFLSLSGLVGSYIIIDVIAKFFITPLKSIPSFLLLIILCVTGFYVTKTSLYLIWEKRRKIVRENMTTSLDILLQDVERFNSVIKAIEINDQIEAAGNPEVSLKERRKVIDALKLTKADLIRALKTERILRENKNFIISNTELFTNNLAALTAMQVNEQASEHGRLLNEALQIALDVQYEMKNLQSQH